MRVRLVAAAAVLLLLLSCKPRQDSSSGTSAVDASGFDPALYSGHSDYRLVFVRRPSPAFDPNLDVLKPTPAAKALEDVHDALRTAAISSLVPVIGFVSGQRTGGETDLMQALMGMAKEAGQALREEVKPILASNSASFPIVSEAMIVPWTEPTQQLFYDAEKVSMNASLANILGVSVADEAFPAKFTDSIKQLREKLKVQSPDPWFLLAGRQFLFLAPGKSRLTLRVLLGLKGLTAPFTKEDAKVRFKQLVVPDNGGAGVVASATFSVDLEGNEEPTLTLEFGDFKGYEKGDFVMDASTQNKQAPRLEGQVAKAGAGFVALNFSFKKLAFNLRTVQLTGIETLLSPGLRLGGANWVAGGLRVESVDQSFQTEINNTIDAQIQGALAKANDDILEGMMTKDMMEQAFKVLFGREQGGGT